MTARFAQESSPTGPCYILNSLISPLFPILSYCPSLWFSFDKDSWLFYIKALSEHVHISLGLFHPPASLPLANFYLNFRCLLHFIHSHRHLCSSRSVNHRGQLARSSPRLIHTIINLVINNTDDGEVPGGEIDSPPNFTSPAQQNQKQAGRAEFQREKTKNCGALQTGARHAVQCIIQTLALLTKPTLTLH